MTLPFLLILFFLFLGSIASIHFNKLTVLGGITGFVIAVLIFWAASFAGIAVLAAFFILASIFTSLGIRQKNQKGLGAENMGKRTAGQVVANAGVGAMLSLLAIFIPSQQTLVTMLIAASLASATSDTISSEFGNAYGKRFYNVITFKKDTRGLNGVISIEGTISGLLGSIAIALVYAAFFGLNKSFLAITLAGIIGNIADSVIGATLERKNRVSNNGVNFLNTLIGASSGYLLYLTI